MWAEPPAGPLSPPARAKRRGASGATSGVSVKLGTSAKINECGSLSELVLHFSLPLQPPLRKRFLLPTSAARERTTAMASRPTALAIFTSLAIPIRRSFRSYPRRRLGHHLILPAALLVTNSWRTGHPLAPCVQHSHCLETLDQDAGSEALCGAANPGCSRLSAGFFVSRLVGFCRKRRSRQGPSFAPVNALPFTRS
jgi:hypothetical protein